MKSIYYYANKGCLKIGNENFNIELLNGVGEGTFWIRLCKKNERINKNKFDFVSAISGDEIYIYESESGNIKIEKLDKGIYYVFKKRGEIIIEKQ